MPTSLSMVVAPVFVTAGVPARTEKPAAVPRPTVGVAAFAVRPAMAPIAMTKARPSIATSAVEFLMPDTLFLWHAYALRVCLCWMVDRVVVRVMTVPSRSPAAWAARVMTNPS